MWRTLVLQAAVGAWVIVSALALPADRGAGALYFAGGLAILGAAGVAATRIGALRWLAVLGAAWLIIATIALDQTGFRILSNALCALVLLATAALTPKRIPHPARARAATTAAARDAPHPDLGRLEPAVAT
jgi:hypothetical protein